jgi:hypothetical protein
MCCITTLKMNPEGPPQTPLQYQVNSSNQRQLVSVVELDKERRGRRDEERRNQISPSNIPLCPHMTEESHLGNHRFPILKMRPSTSPEDFATTSGVFKSVFISEGPFISEGLATEFAIARTSHDGGEELGRIPRRVSYDEDDTYRHVPVCHYSSLRPRSLGHDEDEKKSNLPYLPMDWD